MIRNRCRWAMAAVPLAAMFGPCLGRSAEPAPVDLAGYGRLALQRPAGAEGDAARVFVCQDQEHADRLLSKLQADFSWDHVAGPAQRRLADGQPALALPSGRRLVLARRGQQVYAVTADSEAALAPRLQKLGLAGGQAVFAAGRRHPLSLDFFDLRALSFYYLPLNVLDTVKGPQRYEAEPLERASAFWQDAGWGHSFFGPYFGLDELADCPGHLFPVQWMIRQAVAHDGVVMDHFGAYLAPWWMRNRFPADIVQWDPHVISGWNDLAAMASTHLSQHASPEAFAYAERFSREACQSLRDTAGDHLGCFREVAGGHPGDELAFHHASTEFMDYDVAGQRAFRRWLQEARGLDLAALGRRWHGAADHYRSWDEVQIPSHFEFFGGLGDGTLDLLSDWQWRPDSPQAEAEGWQRPGYRSDESWAATDLAPSMKQLFLFGSKEDRRLRQGKSTVAWLRKEFDATAWLSRNAGRDVYLVAQVGDKKNEPVEVFFNGDYLGPLRPKTVTDGPIAFKATSLLRPGRNVLCLKVQYGLIRGPVFLTTHQPRRYPYLGQQENARWIDLRDWTAAKLITGWVRGVRQPRAALPDIPLLFCPGGTLALADQFLALKQRLGIEAIHHTGGGSGYMPWWCGLGYAVGAYGTSEEGGTIDDPRGQTRQLAWMLLDGLGHHNFYYSAIDYMRMQQKTGWFSQNRRLLDLVGKAHWRRPPVAVFRSARNELYFPESDTRQADDVGYNALSAAHYPNVYVTEAEIRAGLVADYPLVFDAGNTMLDAATLKTLGDYVRGGGTYVAVANTGRHDLLEPDAWPISRLTGLKVLGPREGQRVTLTAGPGRWQRLAGRTCDSEGIALAPVDSAEPAAGQRGLEVLARWSDGTMAAAVRALGRGHVVLLGAAFWRNMSDRMADGVPLGQSVQSTVLRELFASLGVARPIDIDREDVWVRPLVTKNGLQDWIVAWNAGRGPVHGATLRMARDKRPASVIDMVTGRPVPFAYEDGEVRIAGVELEVNQIRVLAMDRGDALAAVEHWFAEKCRYETRAPGAAAAPSATAAPNVAGPSPPATALLLDQFRFRQLASDASLPAGWVTEPTDAAPWKTASYGFWDEQGYAARGVGLYRQTFQVPDSWRGRRVLLGFVSFDCPVFLGRTTVLVNGQAAGEYRHHGWSNFDVLDITSHLVPGENRLALSVEAKDARGGYLGQLVAYALETLDDPRQLDAGWRLFDDNHRFRTVTLPLTAAGRHLETDVDLPAAWQGRQVWLEFEVAERWVGCVVVNGRVIAYNQSLHPYPNIMQINLYPWARPGAANRIELWPRTPGETASIKMNVRGVRIGAGGPLPGGASTDTANAVPLSPRERAGVRGSAERAGNTAGTPPAGPRTSSEKQTIAELARTPSHPNPLRAPRSGRGEGDRAAVINGGFEQWSRLAPNVEKQEQVRSVQLEPAHLAPDGWLPGREIYAGQKPTGRIARDAAIKHGGRYSVRLENDDPRDITFMQFSLERTKAHAGTDAAIRPNRRYAVRWWVRGQQVASGDAGPILMMSILSTREGKTYRTPSSEGRRPLPQGAFDWQQREHVFITDAWADGAVLNFQLRWATGTIWYDDVELIDLGPVVPVETY